MMNNTLSAAELKRRGMAVLEEGLRHGPVRIIKRNQVAAVVLTEAEYRRLVESAPRNRPSVTAVQWLLSQPANGARKKAEIDSALTEERAW